MNKDNSMKNLKKGEFTQVYQGEVEKLRMMNQVLSTLQAHTASNKKAPVQSAINNFIPLTASQ